MNFFENRFIIQIVLILITSGIVMYFCNNRISHISKSVERQNEILSNFISNVKGSIDHPTSQVGGSSHESKPAPEALIAATKFRNEKIYVSDDEINDNTPMKSVTENNNIDSNSESDTDSDDSYSDSEIVTDSETNNDTKEIVISEEKVIQPVTSIDNSNKEVYSNNVLISNATETPIDCYDMMKTHSQNELSNVKKIEIGTQNIEYTTSENNTTETESDTNEADKSETNSNEENTVITTIQEKPIVMYKKLKVEELKNILRTKGLANDDVISKMKKTDLISLLENN